MTTPDPENNGPVSGNQKRKMRSAARLYAVQALFQMEHSSQTVDAVCAEFLEHRFGAEVDDGVDMAEGDVDLFRKLLEDSVNWQARIDQMTDRALVAKWPIARIDPTLRALFRAAGAEMTQSDTPPRVVIMEYVDVAKAFYPDGKEAKFVNAVLDHMAHEAKPDGF
ncbi:NusB antitermination factor [Roseovarius marisflavi]|uniref:Transcription antitermination protein NusB n=1 Tax=Roseovarius marisflavi TaxID=1054996 RepID=A0A1M6WFD5_9RHOB|nr:transcription antitermination factor NusB [Roseovarius marisflavi]SHK92391.1 NusB antitermination factor [Roseovarius marisflavi]